MRKIARSRKSDVAIVAMMGILLLSGLVACQPAEATPAVTPAVTVEALPPPTQAPPLPACADVQDVNLDVQTSAEGEVRLIASGLTPSEKVTVVFYAESAGRTFKIESSSVAGAEGRAEYVENLGKVAGGFFKNWQAQVVHARGIACAAINLP